MAKKLNAPDQPASGSRRVVDDGVSGIASKRRGIGTKLVVSVIAFSSLLTLLFTAFQLVREYRIDVDAVHGELERLQRTHLGPLGAAVWDFDDEQVRELLSGMVTIANIEYAAVSSADALVASQGVAKADGPINETFDLLYKSRHVGVLEVQATFAHVYSRLRGRVYVLLVSNALKTSLVVGFLILIVNRLITRHLGAISAYARRYPEQGDGSSVALKRARSPTSRDELDDVVDALNDMVARNNRQRRELEEAFEGAHVAAKAKEGFLSTMSHEIRTPLNGIVGSVDLLQKGDLRPEQEELLNVAKAAAQELQRTVGDVLDYSKMAYGSFDLECSPFEVPALIEGVVSPLEAAAAERGVRVATHIDPATPKSVLGDPSRVAQILRNILDNAIKFSASDQWVEITVRPGLASGESPAGINIVVRDGGLGMTGEQQASLFQPFVQADGSSKRVHGGSGLGLSIVHQLVGMMGGSVGVESALGQGSTFSIQLPLETVADAEPQVPLDATSSTPPKQQHGGVDVQVASSCQGRFLVAEDNAINRKILGKQLEMLGYTFDMAEDGLAAVALWETNSYELLLTDCDMPNCDGIELTQTIRARESDRGRLPIVAVTANTFGGGRAACLKAGMDDYIAKPVDLDLLDACIKRWTSVRSAA